MEIIKEYIGYWYIPTKKENKVYGALKVFNNNSFKLELCGTLKKLKNDIEDMNIKVINGFSKNGEKITLLNCYIKDFNITSSGIISQDYDAKYMLIGECFDNIEEIKVNIINSNYTDLSKWIRSTPFTCDFNQDDKKTIITYELPENKNYQLEDFKLKINFSSKTDGDLLKEIGIYQNTFITFEELNEKTLEEAMNLINDFSKFLTLCIGENSNPFDINIIDKNNNKIDIYYNGMKGSSDSRKSLYDILIPYPFIKDNFEYVIRCWYEKKEKLEPVIDYTIDAFQSTFYIPMTFLKVIQAFETFSRRMRNNCVINKDEYNQKINYIINRVTDDSYKEWLEEKLRHSNEPSLNNRIKKLFKETDFLIKMNSRRRHSIANKIKDTRNYYTHFDEGNKEKIMSSDQIFSITHYMILCLRVLIMMELGLKEEFIKIQIDRTNELNWIKKGVTDDFKLK